MMTDTITLGTIIHLLEMEGFRKVQLISRGGQGATFRGVADDGKLFCIKLFLYSVCANAEFYAWKQVFNKAASKENIVSMNNEVYALKIDGSKLSFIVMQYYP